MKHKKILILGASGMLGSMVFEVLAAQPDMMVGVTVRDEGTRQRFLPHFRGVSCSIINAETMGGDELEAIFRGYDWVINNIGITKPYTHEEDSSKILHAVRINVVFSHLVGQVAHQTGARVLQIATDCVFDGIKGAYTEKDAHNALDVYGKTKSLGEVFLPNVHHLRCSIVGPEPCKDIFLLAWLLNQPQNSRLKGFTNHQWNGVTTLHFARFCLGIIQAELPMGHLQHVIPGNTISKYELLTHFAREYERRDLEIEPVAAATVIDRTLGTENPDINQKIWETAGYRQPPTIQDMVAQMARFDFSFKRR